MANINYEDVIGLNIRKARTAKGWSQNELASHCGVANTVISAYENNGKTPGLSTIVKIAINLGVSIDQLCFGDESESFITATPDEGRKVVNCIYALWELDVIRYYENFSIGGSCYGDGNDRNGLYLLIPEYGEQIKRLINSLNEFKQKKDTFPNPEMYLENILSSVSKEINLLIEKKKAEKKEDEKNRKLAEKSGNPRGGK